MNTTELGSNFTSNPEIILLSNLTTTTIISPAFPQPPFNSSDNHDPQITIMVVLGLSLLLAGLAAFLAVCRPSEIQDGGSEASCGPVVGWTSGTHLSSEPQLKVWKRLGSYRRSYNFSFRRPRQRRPHECESTHTAMPLSPRTTQPVASVEPHLSTPCLFDYVTEI
uniref:Uncharacterized protein n=1 Tax=Gouania willdenowi TaxID=441366 RepID=A0A8C5NB74_GOUWI